MSQSSGEANSLGLFGAGELGGWLGGKDRKGMRPVTFYSPSGVEQVRVERRSTGDEMGGLSLRGQFVERRSRMQTHG